MDELLAYVNDKYKRNTKRAYIIFEYRNGINDKSKKIYTEAPNQHEALNDPKIRILADYKVEWEQIVTDKNQNDLINNPNLNLVVEECLKTILK